MRHAGASLPASMERLGGLMRLGSLARLEVPARIQSSYEETDVLANAASGCSELCFRMACCLQAHSTLVN